MRDLRRRGEAPAALSGAAPARRKEGLSLRRRAANSLVAEYLKLSECDASLSVFLPESGMSRELFSREDILRAVNLDDDASAEVCSARRCLLEAARSTHAGL